MRWLAPFALLALLSGCAGLQPVTARFENLGSAAVQVHLTATGDTATVFDEVFTVAGGAEVERAVGFGTLTLRAAYRAGDVEDSTSLTVGAGDCADGATVATFTFRHRSGGGLDAFENDGVRIHCA